MRVFHIEMAALPGKTGQVFGQERAAS